MQFTFQTDKNILTCHRSTFFLTNIQETFQYRIGRCGAVNEEQILVVKAITGEPLGIVNLLVEPHNARDMVKAEIWKI